MAVTTIPGGGVRLSGAAGMQVQLNANGSLRRFDCGPVSLLLFIGSELEGGPANLYLRRRAATLEWTPLLGPSSPTVFRVDPAGDRVVGTGSWRGIDYAVALVLAGSAPVWFWHVELESSSPEEQHLDLTYAQDLALAPYGAVRTNEYFVSQYIDHTPLRHSSRGFVIASRQNQKVEGRCPWCLIGSLRDGTSFATDALQFYGLAARAGAAAPSGLAGDLPSARLQHEHSMVVIRDAPARLGPRERVSAGFFGSFLADHPEATAAADLARVEEALRLPESAPIGRPASSSTGAVSSATLFSAPAALAAHDLDSEALRPLTETPWRHEERDARGGLLSFFHGVSAHVVLRAKELRVLRPHGQLLRSGRELTPAEAALTSTVWMNGVFHSLLTQGHVNINRFLSTVRSYLGLYRAHGLRVFVELGGEWRLLDVPSAFEMSPEACRWIYAHERGVLEVRAAARDEPQELALSLEVRSGDPLRFLIVLHVALNGDDGAAPLPVEWRREGEHVVIVPAAETDLARRFPNGSFRIVPETGTRLERVGGDELLFLDGRSRRQPYLSIVTAPAARAALAIRGELIGAETQSPQSLEAGAALAPALLIEPPGTSELAPEALRLAEIVPWFAQNALVHYLSPRGLEQYSGGGWGTRDVCQGPVEMLLALGRTAPLRDVLLRVMGAQNPDGDWPQWFMFFERERAIRAADSHGDIVFWPLVVLAQYLLATGEASVLDERVSFFEPGAPSPTGATRTAPQASLPTVWEHIERALALIERRVIPGTTLAAYAHGDWNDSLQPADPRMREHLCSAWTVTLHVQALTSLARALRAVGRGGEAPRLAKWAQVVREDFQRLLVADGVLAGYALFEGGPPRYLLHPSDGQTGVRYSALAMIHAILEDMLSPEQAREHLQLIEAHLTGPDGLRLFDRPLPYRGGRERLFQRAETATFFGREIGLMYMHAHLRFAQALARMGEAERFFRALCQANPIGVRSVVPSATLRQANCYYSSSDAAFEDRYQARAEYERVAHGTVALEGGWRVYSSGAGIALGLILGRFLGLSEELPGLRVDPVMPSSLDGLRASWQLLGHALEVQYRVGKHGCGVERIELNGTPLAFEREENPYRRGAALVPRLGIEPRLTRERNVLTVEIG
jgi:1,2-beta-oligoglucan phosphorylase